MDPDVSQPMLKGTKPAEMLEAEPEDDPPHCYSKGSQCIARKKKRFKTVPAGLPPSSRLDGKQCASGRPWRSIL